MIRVRFAPSPTGYLHIGGVRTALYNYIFAKHNNGKFILRIEDTDKARSTEKAVENILDSLKWLGLSWDEGPEAGGEYGPYRQTDRLDNYRESCETLLLEENAYLCFCQPDELKKRREEALSKGKPPGYDRRCRDLTKAQINEYMNQELKPVYRFKAPLSGETVVNDMIRGKIIFDNENLDDFVILKNDGTPTYNFAAVVDDSTMDISHVIRGDDHLSNTPKQIALYEALGYTQPQFAHLPMIIGPDKKRLSKRHGATSIDEYKDKGYLPEALLNYLALLGWGFDEKTTFFSMKELIKYFSLQKVSKNPAVFDIQKLSWMNGNYIRYLDDTELAKILFPYFKQAGLVEEMSMDIEHKLISIAEIIKERLNILSDSVELCAFFFKKTEPDDKAKKLLSDEAAVKVLKLSIEKLSNLSEWNRFAIETELRLIPEETGMKAKKVFQPVRAAISGSLISPPLFESLEILGKKETLERLKRD